MDNQTPIKNVDPVFDGEREIKLTNGEVITVRPFTFGSLTMCHKLGLTLFTGEDKETAASHELAESLGQEPVTLDEGIQDQMWQIQTFFWMQSADVPVVLRAIRTDSWRDLVEEFGFQLPLHQMENLMGEINEISQLAAAAGVEVIPNNDDSGEDDLPGE